MSTEKKGITCKTITEDNFEITEQEACNLQTLAEIICNLLVKELEKTRYGKE